MTNKFIKSVSSLNDKDFSLYAPLFYYYAVVSLTLFIGVFSFQYINPNILGFILKEDGPSEWMGFFILFYGSLIAIYLLYKKFEAEKKLDLTYTVLGLLTLAMIFAAMEEISYGQRIFNWSSGEFFQSNNAQKETNLHNMVVNGVKLNKLIFGKILFLAILTHNIIFPLMVKKYEWAKKLHKIVGNFSPLVPQIILLALIALGADLIDSRRRKEIVEVSGCLFYVLAMVSAYGYGIGGPKLKNIKEACVKKMLTKFYIAVPVSALIMTLVYNT